jgi:hypothetical protein
MTRIKLDPNVPVTLKLVDPFADSSERYDPELHICEYRTECGRILALPRQAAIELNKLDLQPQEQVTVCRQGSQISVWITGASERARAEAEEALESPADPSDTELLLEASLKRENGRKRRNGHPTPIRKEPTPAETSQPRLFDRGTGTDGPAPAIQPAALAVPLHAQHKRPPDVIPWNVAFREVAKFVSSELAACHLQWSDEAQQAAVCTVLIAEVKKGRIGLWER